jgi:hypothetical protein
VRKPTARRDLPVQRDTKREQLCDVANGLIEQGVDSGEVFG